MVVTPAQIIFILVLVIIIFFTIGKKDTFAVTDQQNTAIEIVNFIQEQVKTESSGNYPAYLKFMDTLKNKNLNLEKLTTYYYWFELAKEDNLKTSDILSKM